MTLISRSDEGLHDHAQDIVELLPQDHGLLVQHADGAGAPIALLGFPM